eukprot:Colp12_sorted_trinity150504_noHs@25385
MVKQVSSDEEFKAAIASENLTVVDFFAHWCGPCKMIAPYLEELSKEYANVQFIKVDVDELEDLTAKCGISAMPTFQFYKNGNKVAELTGANKTKLKELVEQHK